MNTKLVKKIIALSLATVMVFPFVTGCGSSNNSSTSTANSSTASSTASSAVSSSASSSAENSQSSSAESDFEYMEDEDGNGTQITAYKGNAETVVIPEKLGGKTVTTVSESAFGLGKMKNLVLNEGLEIIEDLAFCGCESLESVKMPSTLKEIGISAFGGCKNLKTVELNEGIEKLGSDCFDETALTELYIPDSIKDMKEGIIKYDKVDSFTIKGKAGSGAEKYAKEAGIKFVAE